MYDNKLISNSIQKYWLLSIYIKNIIEVQKLKNYDCSIFVKIENGNNSEASNKCLIFPS